MCTSAPKDSLMVHIHNMLLNIIAQDLHKGKHAP